MSRFRIEMIVLVLVLALPAAGGTPEPLEQVTVWETEDFVLEIVELSTADRDALLAAPQSAMNRAPSKVLSEAIRIGSVGSIKVQLTSDKVDAKIVEETATYQGWIYYTPISLADGTPHTPAVLCVSQSEEIQWFHCQDMSASVTQRLATDDSDQAANHRIVVFSLNSTDSNSESVAAELTATLIQSLKNVPNIDVVSASDLPDSMQKSGNHHLWPKNELVSLILEGSVRISDEGTRVTVQLIDASSDEHVWSNSFVSDQDTAAEIVASIEKQVIVTTSR